MPDSYQSQFQRSPESKDSLGKALPFTGDFFKLTAMKHEQAIRMKNFTDEEIRDFRIPIQVFNNNVRILQNTRPFLKLRVLAAVGIETSSKYCKVAWEEFMYLYKILQPGCPDHEEVIEFVVRLFNPQLSNFLPASSFVDLFRQVHSPGVAQETIPQELIDKDSLTEITLRACEEYGVFKKDGYLNTEKLYKAIKSGLIDVENLIQ
jgi:hypothetical protein